MSANDPTWYPCVYSNYPNSNRCESSSHLILLATLENQISDHDGGLGGLVLGVLSETWSSACDGSSPSSSLSSSSTSHIATYH